ncbi:MAG: pduB [Lacrimispora sp.]|jgi:microcompartment protein PduB|nr:pduB [Lacrimispora sp.]
MDKDLLDKILSSVAGSENKDQTAGKIETAASSQCNLTEFVGAGIGDTVGLVIANLEYHLHENLKLDPKYRSIGIVSSRTGGAPHVMSADEAVKATNTEVVSVEFCRDTKGGAGHGSTIIFAAEDVSDARRAVEIMLSALDTNFGNVYGCDAGHIELHYTARASYALNKAFNAPIGKAFGITVGAPAAVGLLMADMAMKTANVDIVTYASPASGTCFSNEIIVTFSGDSGAVRQSVLSARDVGLSVLRGMGQNPVSVTTPTL